MGVKRGSFVSVDGETYEVTFTGDSVIDGTLELSVPPVIISMAAGEHKFVGFKSTTAQVNVLTDTPLFDLYSDRVDGIALNVTKGDGSLVYRGYVTPFAFDQPYTRLADVVTINAVDVITARKDINYANQGDLASEHGTDRSALTIVQGICARAGVTSIVEHLNFNNEDDVMATASPLDVKVAQAGFLQDKVSDTDALSAICQFFGYTGHVVGDTLYLYDESCIGSVIGANRYTYGLRGWTREHFGQGDTLNPMLGSTNLSGDDIHSDISVSIERAYDGIQITPSGSSKSVLLPDVCAAENASRNTGSLGDAMRSFQNYDEKTGTDYIQYRTPKSSDVMTLGLASGDTITDAWGIVGGDPVIENKWNGGAMLLDVKHFNRKRYNKPAGEVTEGINLVTLMPAKEGYMIWMSDANGSTHKVGEQKVGCRYSHTGGTMKLSLSWILMRKGNWIDITSPDEQSVAEHLIFGEAKFLTIKCGNKRYVGDNAVFMKQWDDGAGSASVFYTDGKSTTLVPTQISAAKLSGDVLLNVPNDGQICVSLGWAGAPTIYYNDWNIYIESLSLEGWGDEINTACEGLRHSFSNREGGEYLSVETILTTRNSTYANGGPTGINARPGVVLHGAWGWGVGEQYWYYRGVPSSTTIPIAGVLMQQLKERYADKHVAYTMTADTYVPPYKVVGLTVGDVASTLTVEAYDWDVMNNTTRIIID